MTPGGGLVHSPLRPPHVGEVIAALADESDPAQTIRIGQAASWVDKVDGLRDALAPVPLEQLPAQLAR